MIWGGKGEGRWECESFHGQAQERFFTGNGATASADGMGFSVMSLMEAGRRIEFAFPHPGREIAGWLWTVQEPVLKMLILN